MVVLWVGKFSESSNVTIKLAQNPFCGTGFGSQLCATLPQLASFQQCSGTQNELDDATWCLIEDLGHQTPQRP